MSVRARCAAVALVWLAIGPFGSAAFAGDGMALGETEVYAFLWELNAAGRRCDAEWLTAHYLPTATLTFEIQGRSLTTLNRDEYFAFFRKHCFHIRQSSDRQNLSVKIAADRATVFGRWEQASVVRYFFVESFAFDWIEETMSVVRGVDGALGVESVYQCSVLRAEPEANPGDRMTHDDPH